MNEPFPIAHLLKQTAAVLTAMPGHTLFQLKSDATDQLATAQAVTRHLNQALALKYAGQAQAQRLALGKDSGVVHFDDGRVRITAELPGQVEWDQARLAQIVRRIAASGDDPAQYVEIHYHVPEARFAAWPETFKSGFLLALLHEAEG